MVQQEMQWGPTTSHAGEKFNSVSQRIQAMTYTFSDQKSECGVNEALSLSGINLMVSFQDNIQNMFCILAKISHPADLEISNDIELY